jgi:hypothetical protein
VLEPIEEWTRGGRIPDALEALLDGVHGSSFLMRMPAHPSAIIVRDEEPRAPAADRLPDHATPSSLTMTAKAGADDPRTMTHATR